MDTLASALPNSPAERPRVSAVVLRNAGRELLLVQHRRKDGTTYWQLPGGGLLSGETLEAAVLRELHEETGLTGRVVRWLFTIPYRLGRSTTFLVEIATGAQASLGSDPEEQERDFHKLAAVAWWPLGDKHESPEAEIVRILLPCLSESGMV